MTAVEPTAVTNPVGAREFRDTLGRFTTGVVAITALPRKSPRPVGLVANSFASVSLDPPLILFCIAHTSSSWPQIRSAEHFCVNILGEHQRDVSIRFATSGGDKFETVPWSTTTQGTPTLNGAIGWLECVIEAEYPAGDHDVVIARVSALGNPREGAPLLFFGGHYGRYAAL